MSCSGSLMELISRVVQGRLQDSRYRIGNLGFTGSGRAYEKQAISRKCVGPVDLNDRLDDSVVLPVSMP